MSEKDIASKQVFTMKDYGKKSTFSSFLPGVSGIKGIPMWCYYVNRGQCVVSFGTDNKDHAIMEFYPAHVAYQNVKTTGFRTFIKKDGAIVEPFSDETVAHSMDISKNGLQITETNDATHLETKVTYFTLPNEKISALVRKVQLTNLSRESAVIEILDGMPSVIPYGVGEDSMKKMTQTTKAWMQVEDAEKKVPYYRVRVSMDDSAAVHKIDGGNFTVCFEPDGSLLQPVVDPFVIFSYDNSLRKPVTFYEHSVEEMLAMPQNTQNQLPSSFYGLKKELKGNESMTFYTLIGQVENKTVLNQYLDETRDGNYFELKKKEADDLVEDVCEGITTKTASADFDEYCKYTYLDNVLRGGYPMKLGSNKIFYVYSRKHGDLERDYNFFSMLPEFYSQGNGNFRDVNQNRRCDVFFAPFVERENIHEFYSLIQLDGYNPLGVEKITYCLPKEKGEQILDGISGEAREAIEKVVYSPYTPGSLYRVMDEALGKDFDDSLFFQTIDFSDSMVNGNFGEGYWSDHWTYNLDLIHDYLEVYPEKEEEMLYEKEYTCFLSQVNINPRRKRYAKTAGGLRQYHALDEATKRNTTEKLVRVEHGKGAIYKTTLMEKLILLCATKFAALDAYGMGIEMEGGKPGWYDALNGMPGMFGSSMAETYELARMLDYTISVLEKYPAKVMILKELSKFLEDLDKVNRAEKENIKKEKEVISFWNGINDAKESYREIVFGGIAGDQDSCDSVDLVAILRGFRETVEAGIEKACEYGKGICPTYFTYEVPDFVEEKDGITPLHFEVTMIPYFLEGPVRYLKLAHSGEVKKKLYENVKHSDLYDEKLSMYKVNASLQEASFELGRARAFTPGWLENESIWLHMEYKYLLELIRSGMYQEFFDDFHKAAIPFLDPTMYGRSIYENSSFLASSKNPDASIRGKGFVARLSGSTIEFISMWKCIMFGPQVIKAENGEMIFAPSPAIPSYLIPEDGTVKARLFGNTEVTYVFPEKKDYIPGQYTIKQMDIQYKNGFAITVASGMASGKTVKDIRDQKVKAIRIEVM